MIEWISEIVMRWDNCLNLYIILFLYASFSLQFYAAFIFSVILMLQNKVECNIGSTQTFLMEEYVLNKNPRIRKYVS